MKPYQTENVLDALERVHAIIAGSGSIDALLPRVLDEMLEIFDCDRAWLLYPCNPEAASYGIPMERTRPDWPGAGGLGAQIPSDDYAREVFRQTLELDAPMAFEASERGPDSEPPVWQRFHVQSQLVMAIRPRGDQAWMLGIHNCAEARRYGAALPLFGAIGRRIGDALTTFLATRQLRQSQERFQTLVEDAPEAIVVLDAETLRFDQANAKATALYGTSRDALLGGLGFLDVSPDEQPDQQASAALLESRVQHTLANGQTSFEWLHSRGGEHVPCEVRLVALPDPDRVLIRASITDISARVQAEEARVRLESQLAQAQKMEAIGQLTGGVAHDFNNLLTVILGNLDLVMMQNLGEENRSSLDRAMSATLKASRLVRQLLAFSRQQPLQPVAVDVSRLLTSVEQLLSRTLGEDIELEMTVAGEARCDADPSQLQTALLNLAINARDAMPAGGRLRISVEQVNLDASDDAPADFVRFRVVDEGTGIEPALLDAIFAPFFTTKDVGEGTGLGLAMVYGFAKQSGGHLRVQSELGRGSTFELFLPVASVEEPVAAPVRLPAARGTGQLILLVEDDLGVRRVVHEYLTALGYGVVEASTGPEALERLRATRRAALLLTDVILPGGLTGAQLAQEARELRPTLPVVYMSGYTEKALLTRGRLPDGIFLLEKPFSREELASHLTAALHGSSVG